MTTSHPEAAAELDFSKLAPHRPRSFVPVDADPTDPQAVAALYQQLVDRPVGSAAELVQWLLDRSELDAVVSQTGSALYIRMTCQTDAAARAEAYKAFVECVRPVIEPLADKLDRKYLAAREQFELDTARYGVYDRGTRADVELFREENVPLQTESSLLSQEYQAICGAMSVEFQDRERTLPEMGKFLLETDREVRESAWRATAARRLVDAEKLEDLFDRMLPVRGRVAGNADCADFREYCFRSMHRFDYTPADCRAYHDAVAKCVVPVWRQIQQDRQTTMGVDTLRPWDAAVDPKGRPPLKPFEQSSELIAGAEKVFGQLDAELGGQFSQMAAEGLLDLSSRKGKAPGGYQSSLSEARKPFIFMNAVGLNRDVSTLLHEGGHAFHSLAAADEDLMAYRHAPMEFCEVASMSMELLALEHLSVFYDGDDLRRARRDQLEGTIHILPWVATIDAFQHWLYTNPGHTPAARRAAWLETAGRFDGGVVDWTGLDAEHAQVWHRQLHLFQCPFYYIEYGIAQLGALQLWVRARQDAAAALADYRRALGLGGSKPLPELFAAAGLKFDFSEATIAPLMAAVTEELARM